ncbi:MAG: hypothetical protein ACXVP0_04630 [Bacteroidia bacterium]
MEAFNDKLKIRGFRAVNEPATCQIYGKGHLQVLVDYNVMKVTSYNNAWMSNPSAYVVIAEQASTGEMVGGIRVEVAKGVFPLPIETAIGQLDSRIHEKIRGYALHGGCGELCGLWNSKEVKGVGISFFLTRAAVSIVNQLKFKTMVGICAEYTLRMFADVGFEIDNSVGNNGEFPYPDDRYLTRALGILNAETLETANPYDKERMLGLRNNPVQTRVETGSRGDVEVTYDLRMEDIDDSEYRINQSLK